MFNCFFFNDTATTEIYTLSLHDALPISPYAIGVTGRAVIRELQVRGGQIAIFGSGGRIQDRKSTRLNSSHSQISYAVFCLKKKKETYAAVQLDINGVIQRKSTEAYLQRL